MIKSHLTSLLTAAFLATPAVAHDLKHDMPETNIGIQIVALGAPVYVGDVNATIGNMWCGGAENASFTISANHSVSCSFTHTHDTTAVYFQLITSAPAKQKCAFVVTHDFLNWSDGIHLDPDNHLPSYNCAGIDIRGGQIIVHAQQ